MVIANNQPIWATDLNGVFSDGAGGLTNGLDAKKLEDNGYTTMRVRKKGVVDGHIARFTVPDDFDLYVVGLNLYTQQLPVGGTGNPVTFRATLHGSIGDAQNDLPIPEHLYLTEPVTNIDGRNYMELIIPVGPAADFNSVRYTGYDLNPNRASNTLLKGVEYQVDIEVIGDMSVDLGVTDYTMDFFMLLKTRLRRN